MSTVQLPKKQEIEGIPMCHSQSMKTLEVEESDNLFHSCKVKTEKVKPLQISVLSTADPRFMTTEHRKTESDDYLC